MNRPSRLFALVALSGAIAACTVGSLGDVPSPSPSPTPSPTPSPSPTPVETPAPAEPTTDPSIVLAATGIGPYVIGTSLSELQSRALVTNVERSVLCNDDWEYAEATGRYAEQISLTFHFGRLVGISAHSIELVTPSGARIEMPLTELQRIYGSSGTLINGTLGNQGYSVRVPDTDLGIMFYLDETNTRTSVMGAGEVKRMEDLVVNGEGC
jgi:hypothetical protein